MAKGTNIGKAYVQIVPSADGIKGSITQALGDEPTSAGKLGGSKLVTALKGAIAVAGIGKALSASITAGADLQQSLGGVETLFKDSADKVKQYASESFRTTGLSANAYMENVTGFSASLLQSLGGDTQKASEIANMAMVDMADNSNKMGTSMQSIQDAYQGFAKQNYTMLDNLKLGYGGTKTEMERLLADAQKLTGVKYDINNLSDVYQAIHAIQENLGITGTTAREAKETFTGSFNAMKASAIDLLGALSTGMDVTQPMANLLETVSTFFFGNLLPMLGNIVMSLPKAVLTAFQTLFPFTIQQGHEMINKFVQGFKENFPTFIQSASEFIQTGITFFMENLQEFRSQGASLVMHVLNGLIEMTPTLLSGLATLVIQAVATFAQNLPQFIQKGFEIIGNVVSGLLQAVPNLIGAIPSILVNAGQAFLSYDWWSIGKNIISGIVNGLISAGGQIISTLMDLAKSAFDSVLNFFGIKSPSRLFRDKVGKMIPAGIAVGIEADTTLPKQIKAMAERTINDARLNFSNADAMIMMKYSSLPKSLDNTAVTNNSTRTVNQTINSAKELSPSEMAQETENMLRRLEWA